ncbi:MAG: N-acetyl-gamma-glutamyl-phosphate reductase [bacterium]
MLKVGIFGATGYTGAELVRILVRHSHIKINYLSTNQYIGKKFSEVFPAYRNILDIHCSELKTDDIDIDVAFTALPHHEAYKVVKPLLDRGIKVIDLSADFRLKDYERYKEWYGEHPYFGLTKDAVYGLPELFREEIKKTKLVANPGCYPTSAILPLFPLLKENVIHAEGVIVDSKSGVTGAGRGLSLKTHFCEVYGGFKAYNVTKHRHQPEIEEVLSLSGEKVSVLFTPHLLPIKRGILTTAYGHLKSEIDDAVVFEIYNKYYGSEKFVRIFDEELPSIEGVVGSNYCDIGFRIDRKTELIITVSAIDNLTKGASGQAVQNMNIMCGFPEGEALDLPPLFP